MSRPPEALEERLQYRFNNRNLLVRALTHRSWGVEHVPAPAERADNEQLEFLGDSILGFVVSEHLLRKHPSAAEGALSQAKSHLVSSVHLHHCALGLELGDFLVLGRGEERNGGRERRTLLANAFEAIIAAVYLDGGLEPASRLIHERIIEVGESVVASDDVEAFGQHNFKSILQERSQALGLPVPRYVTVETSGPEHAKVFTVEARIDDQFTSRATGSSKKSASQLAAQQLIGKLAPS
jgi:ribonuclease III